MNSNNIVIENIKKEFPCREKIIQELYNYIGDPNDSYPDALFVHGDMSTGKTSLLRKYLINSGSKFAFVDLIECYMNKILFGMIINDLKYTKEQKQKQNLIEKYENMQDFIWEMKKLEIGFSYIICLDNAERLRDMDANILPSFCRLQELTGLNICCVLLSQLPLEKFYLKTGLNEMIEIYLPQYNKNEVQTILLNDFKAAKNFVKFQYKNKDLDSVVMENFFENMNQSFYENYLNAFLSVFYRSCRDLNELKFISKNVFQIYCDPVLKGEIEENDVSKLWRYISNPLKMALANIYTRMENDFNDNGKEPNYKNDDIKNAVKSLELPYYGKYLLIAAFLASHNPAKDDKKIFVKLSGRQKKRLQTVNANAKVTDKLSTSLGPKSFSIDRLLAIFYSILEEKIGLTCNLLAQISTLVQLKFLIYVSGESNILEGSAKLQCVVGLDFITHIGKLVGFNVKQYLSDFM